MNRCSQRDVTRFLDLIRLGPAWLAKTLGVPAVMTNKASPWKTPMPFIFPPADAVFCGASGVFDAQGRALIQLGEDEGVAIAGIVLDPIGRPPALRATSGHWSRPMPWFTRVWRLAEACGSLYYGLSRERRLVAERTAS